MTDVIRSRKSNKTAATVAGTLVVRCNAGPDKAGFACQEELATLLSRLIGEREAVQQNGDIAVEEYGAVLELRCLLNYGPVLGGYESDLGRQAESIRERMLDNMDNDASVDAAVFDVVRHELTKDDLKQLADKVHDIQLSLFERKRLEIIVKRLQ